MIDETPPELPDPEPRDHMAPPEQPCECWCMHCHRTFMSNLMWFQKMIGDPSGFDGFWMCPTPNCGGAGFTFDIFPTDPDHPANDGWHDSEDDGGDDDSEDEADWDPAETKYAEMDDEIPYEDEEDLAGEEWKQGLEAADRSPASEQQAQARREREEEEKKYDEPDSRPREIYWTDRHKDLPPGTLNLDDDIPF